MRDIDEYSEKYSAPGFEQYKVHYRRKKILEVIAKYSPEKVLEIGCGYEPLFKYEKICKYTIVEPSTVFFEHAQELMAAEADKKRICCIQGFFEEVTDKIHGEYDLVVCSSLLHEVEQPETLLQAIAGVCGEATVVHINVPNANSMHRLLGREMGLLKNVHDMSRNNEAFQQNRVFDSAVLREMVTGAGFEVLESGSFFVKPFSHAQMYEMMEKGILNDEVLDGLYQLGEHMPEFGSEIYVNCKLKG